MKVYTIFGEKDIPKDNYYKYLYTLEHKKAFLAVENTLLGSNTKRGFYHDADKLLNLANGMDLNDVSIRHMNALHHVHNITKNVLVNDERIFDYECSGLTKTQAQLNAYDFLTQKAPNLLKSLGNRLIELKINDSFDHRGNYGCTMENKQGNYYNNIVLSDKLNKEFESMVKFLQENQHFIQGEDFYQVSANMI